MSDRPLRLASLDQFRGYTVAAMIGVNFLGRCQAVPPVFKHHNTYCSYADTVMPQFFFAVGFAYRLTFLRRRSTVGALSSSLAVVRRALVLILIGVVLYHLDGRYERWSDLRAAGALKVLTGSFQRVPFQTLVHIALATLWTLPVIGSSRRTRLAFLLATALLHLALSRAFYFEWVWRRPGIDGGPLGFLTWSLPLLVGSLAHDALDSPRALARLIAAAVGLMTLGYALACLGSFPAAPPFVAESGPVNLWSMSQRTGSVSYLAFASGFSLAVFAGFVLISDRLGLTFAPFRTFGTNALAAYILHGLVSDAVDPFVPRDSPGGYVAAALAVDLGINYLLIRGLERAHVYLKL